MAEFAREAAVPGEEPAAADDAEADAGVDVEHGEIADAARQPVVLLGEAEGVRLLEQDARQAEGVAEVLGGAAAVGDRRVRRQDRLAGAVVEQARQAQADAERRDAGLGEAVHQGDELRDQLVIGVRRRHLERRAVQHAVEAGGDDAAAVGIDGDADDAGRPPGEPELGRGPAAGRPGRGRLLDEAGAEQDADGARDGRGAEAAAARDLGARHRPVRL